MFRKVNIDVLGHGREHELLPLPQLPGPARHFRLRRREAAGGRVERALPRRSADPHAAAHAGRRRPR